MGLNTENLQNPFAVGDFIGRSAITNRDAQVMMGYLVGMDSYLEIGTLFGGSAILAGHAVSGSVYCIDPLDGYYGNGEPDPITGLVPSRDIVIDNWVRAGLDLGRIQIWPFATPPLPDGIPDRVDIALIDGDHSEKACQTDFDLLKGRVNHIIFFHDIDQEPVKRVFERACLQPGWNRLYGTDTLGVIGRDYD